MNAWAPLSDGLVDSTIWQEPDHVFRVFVGMMSIKGPDHVVRLDSYKLHRRLHMELGLVLDALKVLTSPDKRKPGQPHDGRRLEAVEGGWFFLNGEHYRDQTKLIMKRARDQRAQANYRAKKAGKPLPYPSAKSHAAVQEYAPTPEQQARMDEAHVEVHDAVKNLDAVQREVQLPHPEG